MLRIRQMRLCACAYNIGMQVRSARHLLVMIAGQRSMMHMWLLQKYSGFAGISFRSILDMHLIKAYPSG